MLNAEKSLNIKEKGSEKIPFARKYRPQTFSELVGQEIISETLKRSIQKNQIAQAFLFCGGRGTGKTSCARIFAKALNCTNPQELEPCNACENCMEINKDCAIDIIEIDAASNRGIDNIRKIRENLSYLPIKCKFKVYIIDEVHMLTMESFNALLKSIEEPPKYLKFILATTHPYKIPETVLSRCQRYNFYNIPSLKMKTHLQKIAALEKIQISELALEKIIQTANGALRDALSNLEMVYSFCGEKITEQEISKILITTSQSDLSNLLLAIIKKNSSESIAKLHSIFDKGIALSIFLTDFLFFIHQISIQKITADFSKTPANLKEPLQKISFSKLQQYFQVLLDVEQNIKMSKMTNLCVEMGILKLCSITDFANLQDILQQIESQKENLQQITLGNNENKKIAEISKEDFELASKVETETKASKEDFEPASKPETETKASKKNFDSASKVETKANKKNFDSASKPETETKASKKNFDSIKTTNEQKKQLATTNSFQNDNLQEQDIDERVKIAQNIFTNSQLTKE